MKDLIKTGLFTENFDLTFVSLIKENNVDKLIKKIENELISDCVSIKTIIDLYYDDKDTMTNTLLNYISKYGFLIYILQAKEEYEGCRIIQKLTISVMTNLFIMNYDEVNNLLSLSITLYNKNLDDN